MSCEMMVLAGQQSSHSNVRIMFMAGQQGSLEQPSQRAAGSGRRFCEEQPGVWRSPPVSAEGRDGQLNVLQVELTGPAES